MQQIAKFTSWLFLPLLTPVYALLAVMFVESWEENFMQPNSLFILTEDQKYAILYLFIAFSFLAPAITILFLQIRGAITSVLMDNRKERVIPSILVNLFGIALIVMLHKLVPNRLPGFYFLLGLAYGSLATVFICTVLTIKWKVSLHAAGMGILTGFLYGYYSHMEIFPILLVTASFVLSGFVMSMRMYIKAHDLKQSIIGYFIGFIATTSAVFFFYV